MRATFRAADVQTYAANLFAQFIGRLCSLVSGLLVFAIVARVFGAEGFGRYSLVLTLLSVLVVIADFGTTPVLAREISRPGADRERVWGDFLRLRLALAALVSAGGLVFASLYGGGFLVLLLIGVVGLPMLASRFFEPVFQVSGRPWYSTLALGSYALVHVAGVVAAALWLDSLLCVVVAYVAANAVYAVLAFSLSRRCLRPRLEAGLRGSSGLLRLAAPLGVSSLFVIVNTRADVILLAHLQSEAAVGLYSAAFRFFEAAAMVAAMVTVPLIPIFSEKATRDRSQFRALYARIHELLGVILIPAAIAVPAFSNELMARLLGPEFAASGPVLSVLAWAGVLVFGCQISTAATLAVGEVRYAYWNAAVAAAVNIALNLLWIPRFGILGAAWATLVSEIVLLAVRQHYAWKHLGNAFRLGRWVRIALANAAVGLLLLGGWVDAPLALRLPAAALVYACLLVGLGIVRRRTLGPLWDLRRRFAVGEVRG